jgi:hypothetical protein
MIGLCFSIGLLLSVVGWVIDFTVVSVVIRDAGWLKVASEVAIIDLPVTFAC